MPDLAPGPAELIGGLPVTFTATVGHATAPPGPPLSPHPPQPSIAQSLSSRRKEIIGIIRVKHPESHHDDVNLGYNDDPIPRDVAVVGFGNTVPGWLTDPPLTTVHQPMRMLGMRACTRLIERIAAPGLPPSVELLPTELVIRSSCGCPPGTSIRQPVRPAQE